jgi:hypothetical protein
MPAGWLYATDPRGLLVTATFLDRLRSGEASAWRALTKEDLTTLYRRGYSKLKGREDEVGLFYSEPLPPLTRIPFVRGGSHPAGAWIEDYTAVNDERMSAKQQRAAIRLVQNMKTGLSDDEALAVRWEQGGSKLTVKKIKPNPKFELVVINKHDRAALLKLLGEVDAAANVGRWLADRTRQTGATAPSVLHADYAAWCEQRGQAAAGMKGFAQALVAAGVTKLTRSAGSVRYELELR